MRSDKSTISGVLDPSATANDDFHNAATRRLERNFAAVGAWSSARKSAVTTAKLSVPTTQSPVQCTM